MLGHWGKKTNVRNIQGKNPVIGIVPDEITGKDMREKYLRKYETNIWCKMGDGKGEARKIILYNLSC